MQIVFAVHGYKPAWRIGGPVHSVSAVAERLVRRGHQVTVVTSNSNLDEDLDVPIDTPVTVEGVTVYYFKRDDFLKRAVPGLRYLSQSIGFLYSKAMRPRLDELVPRADVVHTHLPFNYPTYSAAHAAFRHHKPLVYHQRGVFDPARLNFRSLKKRLYLGLVEKPILNRAAMLIALTKAELESYRFLGVQTPCEIIPNGVNVEDHRGTYDMETLQALGIRKDDVVVLFLGRIHPIKGADLLLRAFAQIASRVPAAKLVLAGPDEFGLQEQFKRQASHAGLQDRVVFPGMVQGSKKLALLARADIFCLPSAAEGFSMAVLEALASRTAVLLSPGCNFPDVVQVKAGRICEPTVRAIGDNLESMILDRSELRAMGERGSELVRTHFDWESITDRLLDVYERVIYEPNDTRRDVRGRSANSWKA